MWSYICILRYKFYLEAKDAVVGQRDQVHSLEIRLKTSFARDDTSFSFENAEEIF